MSDEHWLIDHLLGEQSDAEAAEAQRRLDADRSCGAGRRIGGRRRWMT